MGSPFIAAAGLPLSHLDKLVLATRDLIAGDPQLSAWCEGRVYRDDPLAVPLVGRAAPWISCCPASLTTEFKVGCAVKTFKVSTVIVYSIGTAEIGDDEATESAVAEQWERVLMGNTHLQVPRFGNESIAMRLTQLEAPDFFVADLKSETPGVFQILTATYEKHWNSRTWTPEA
jgi:hypothetical protein